MQDAGFRAQALHPESCTLHQAGQPCCGKTGLICDDFLRLAGEGVIAGRGASFPESPGEDGLTRTA